MAYVFCKHREDQTAIGLVLSLVAQLARQHSRLSAKLSAVGTSYKDRKKPETVTLLDCMQILESEARQFKRVFFIVDALDERLDNGYAYQLLDIIQKIEANVLITSRDVGSIRNLLAGADSIEIMAQEEDIRAYLDFRFQQMQAYKLRQIAKKGQMDKNDIIEALVLKADGM